MKTKTGEPIKKIKNIKTGETKYIKKVKEPYKKPVNVRRVATKPTRKTIAI